MGDISTNILSQVLNDDERREVIERLFVKTGLLERPRSMKKDRLFERTEGFTGKDLKKLADELESTGKTLNASIISRYVRERQRSDEPSDECSLIEDSVLENEELRVLEHVENEDSDKTSDDMEKDDSTDKQGTANSQPSIAEVLMVVDATKKMKGMEDVLKTGISQIANAAVGSDARITVVTFGKHGSTLLMRSKEDQIPKKSISKCAGSAKPVEELLHEIAKSNKRLENERPEKKVAVLVADLGGVDISDKKLMKKLAKQKASGWEIVIAAYSKKKVRAKMEKGEVFNGSYIPFKRDGKGLEQAFSNAAALLKTELSH